MTTWVKGQTPSALQCSHFEGPLHLMLPVIHEFMRKAMAKHCLALLWGYSFAA